MKYIDSWLKGLGLDYVIPKLKQNNITTPKKLATLTLRDMFEFGIEDPEDRKKLYFLIQRLQTILSNRNEEDQTKKLSQLEVKNEEPISTTAPVISRRSSRNSGTDEEKILRQKYRDNVDNNSNSQSEKVTKKKSDNIKIIKSENVTPLIISPTAAVSQLMISPRQLLSENNTPRYQHPMNSFSPTSKNDENDPCSMGGDSNSFNDENDNILEQKINSILEKNKHEKKHKIVMLNVHASPSNASSNHHESVNEIFTPRNANVPPLPSCPAQIHLLPSTRPPMPPSGTSPSINQNRSSQSPVKSPRKQVEIDPIVTAAASAISNLQTSQAEMAIRVVVRKRPISRIEKSKGDYDVLEIDDNGLVLVHEPKIKVDLTKIIETQSFIFDDAFQAEESNELIYSRTIGHLVPFVFEGGKASCFAYGQTGSGKTFTMMGSNPENPASVLENAGLYVLAARDVFRIISMPHYKDTFRVFVSCFEIYGGKLFDLLNDRSIVKCLEDAKQQVQLPGLTEHEVKSVDTLLQLMEKAHSVRSTGSTGANATSSRSHQIMQIVVKEEKQQILTKQVGLGNRRKSMAPAMALVPRGKLSFIDLAGSERGVDTRNNDKQTRLEGAEINTSLLALKEVIRSLAREKGHTPFRGSKLTQVLKDSFVGEKSRTCMIACVSPSHSNCEHTLNTLRYADRVKEHQSVNKENGSNYNSDSDTESNNKVDEYALFNKRAPVAITSVSSSLESAGIVNILKSASSIAPANPTYTSNTSSSSPPQISKNKLLSAASPKPFSASPEKQTPTPAPTQAPRPPLQKSLSVSSNITNNNNSLEQRPLLQKSNSVNSNIEPSSSSSSSAVTGKSKIPNRRASIGTIIPKKSNVTSTAQQQHPSSSNSTPSSTNSSPPANARTNTIGTSPLRGSKASVEKVITLSPQPSPSNTELQQKKSVLLSAHKSAIASMVEVMKQEMELVQEMETADDRDAELYVDKLEKVLNEKSNYIQLLQMQLRRFQQFRKGNRRQSTSVGSQ